MIQIVNFQTTLIISVAAYRNNIKTAQTPKKCQCGPKYNNAIECNEKTMISAVTSCYCVTKADNTMYASYCFYNYVRRTTKDEYPSIYHIFSDKADLNEYICGQFKRT